MAGVLNNLSGTINNLRSLFKLRAIQTDRGKTALIPKEVYAKLQKMAGGKPGIQHYDALNKLGEYYFGDVLESNRGGAPSRLEKCREYIFQDQNSTEAGIALDAHADEAVQLGRTDEVMTVHSDDKVQKLYLDSKLKDLRLSKHIRDYARTLAKFGDLPIALDIREGEGVTDTEPVNILKFNRIDRKESDMEEQIIPRYGLDKEKEDEAKKEFTLSKIRKVLLGYKVGDNELEPWQLIHYKIYCADHDFYPYGKCLKWDTYVETKDGYKFIKDIEEGERIYSFNIKNQVKQESIVAKRVCAGEKEIVHIATRHFELECSIEHKLLCYNNLTSSYSYKGVDKLNIGDCLVLDKVVKTGVDVLIKKDLNSFGNKNGWKNSVELIPKYFTVDFARLWGFLLGDGWILNKKYDYKGQEHYAMTVSIALGLDDKTNNYYIKLLEKFTGKKGRNIKCTRPICTLSTAIASEENPVSNRNQQCIFHSKMLVKILEINGFEGDVYSKRLPNWIWNCKKEIKEALLQGLMDADGSVTIFDGSKHYKATPKWKWVNKRYSLELTNEYLIKDIRMLLHSLNRTVSRVGQRDRSDEKCIFWGKTYERKKSYYINFYGSNLRQVKKLKKRECSNVLIESIISIEVLGNELVYDLQIEGENKNFYANGIVVHNSFLEASRATYRQLLSGEILMALARAHRFDKINFEVDANTGDPVKDWQILEKIRQLYDENVMYSEGYNYKNPIGLLENIWSTKSMKVNRLGTSPNLSDISDIEYLEKKYLTGLGLPKAYLLMDNTSYKDGSLVRQDIKFGRRIYTLQSALMEGVILMLKIDMIAAGKDKTMDINSFALSMPFPAPRLSLEEAAVKKEQYQNAIDILKNIKELLGMEKTTPQLLKALLTRYAKIDEEEADYLITFLVKAELEGETGKGVEKVAAESLVKSQSIFTDPRTFPLSEMLIGGRHVVRDTYDDNRFIIGKTRKRYLTEKKEEE